MNTEIERLLSRVLINERGPGSVLRDFETLLDFVGVDGVKAGGKHGFLPMSCLKELDERLTRPLRPALQRPKQESYPHIHGLYLLLRGTGLGIIEGSGSNCRLCVDPEILSLWRQLNPTERYFNLLEAWLIIASAEVWGRQPSWLTSLVHEVHQFAVAYLIDRRRDMAEVCRRFRVHQQAYLALFEMFGLAELECQPPQPKENWHVVSAECTEFGIAILSLVKDLTFSNEFIKDDGGEKSFGVLQPLLGPYFPAWKNNLVQTPPEFREGVHYFKVAWDRTWRRIAIPASCDFEELALAILDVYDFDDDHLYCFTCRDRFGRQLSVEHPACDAKIFADALAIGAAPIRIGETIEFLYDFGDEWRFKLNLERLEPPDPKLRGPELIDSHGESPPQYDWGDDEAEGDWD